MEWRGHRLKLREDVLYASVGDEAVLLDSQSQEYFALNPVGALAWRMAGEGADFEAICGSIREQFSIDGPAAEQDLSAFLSQLVQRGFVELVPQPIER